MSRSQPNVVFVFGDQWRAQSLGYAGDPDVKTPHIDRLAASAINFPYAVSGIPVCTPYRACFLTGRRALSTGMFANDLRLDPQAPTIGKSFKTGGYDTAYIGKWHLDIGRTAYIPPERRQGFDYFDVLNCTHKYNDSKYYHDDDPTPRTWQGYDAIAQTDAAARYIRGHRGTKPFFLVVSWGPPHSPYLTAPPEYRALYNPRTTHLRPNVPPHLHDKAREAIAGYNAHCTALDDCVQKLLDVLDERGLADDTIFVFTSDHGDMVGSQGMFDKQAPWDESIRVPFLIRWPGGLGAKPRTLDALIDAPDLMPTLLSLCGLPIPGVVEGLDYSDYLRGGKDPSDGAAFIYCVNPFATWDRKRHGGREYRGLRTKRHTYVRALDGPWMLYDNEADPYQLKNLVNDPAHAALVREFDDRLSRRLADYGDEFLHGHEYMKRFGYAMDEYGAVPIIP